MSLSRREMMARTGAVGAAVAFTGAVDQLFVTDAAAAERGGHGGYGPLQPDPAGILDLPKGFRYKIVSREGGQLSSGQGKVPGRADGMAAFARKSGGAYLVRNHENRPTAPLWVPRVKDLTYDPMGPGGCTAVEVDRHHRLVSEQVGIAGTAVNCAGGRTPWGTWLTCEETEDKAGTSGYTKDHGWIFEVHPHDMRRNRDPFPLTAMGRFQHEATATDPHTGTVYETEDAFDFPFGLFYRFLPKNTKGGWGSLRAGGRLEAMRVPGVPDLSAIDEIGTVFRGIEWVEVPDPSARQTPIRNQDFGKGGITHAQKLEGAYWGNGCAYFVSSFAKSEQGSLGDHIGQVWRYNPRRKSLELVVLFGPDRDVDEPGDSPDNMCLSPHGDMVLAEDGDGEQYIIGATRDGEAYPLARNRINNGTPGEPEFGELAGVTFSADGRTLYFNVYTPGTTFAVTGPWH